MADGTVKQVNPFTGVEVWAVPERGRRLLYDTTSEIPSLPIEAHSPEDYCAFCVSRMLEVAPEKARIVRRDGKFEIEQRILPSNYSNSEPLFRRVSNLFEIVSIEYWRKNFNYRLSKRNAAWKEKYLADPIGIQHVLDLLDYRFRRTGKAEVEIDAMSMEEKLLHADAFFGGGHEVIISSKHYRDGAKLANELHATADLSEEEHYEYFNFIIDGMRDIIESNRYVRYISVFKNWLKPAGATLEHLHTQMVAIDEWGEMIERQIKMIIDDKNVFNTRGPNFAGHHNLVFAENEHALAYVGTGHRYPTIEIYSKSPNARPNEQEPDEVRGMSDLVRACHAAVGDHVSVNEEWYYTPIDSIFKMPWHIHIKLRINVPAGFEGGTNIFINPLTPIEFRDRIVPVLYSLRESGRISSGIRIAEECKLVPNPLQYFKNT